jgi:hypothetical protein
MVRDWRHCDGSSLWLNSMRHQEEMYFEAGSAYDVQSWHPRPSGSCGLDVGARRADPDRAARIGGSAQFHGQPAQPLADQGADTCAISWPIV